MDHDEDYAQRDQSGQPSTSGFPVDASLDMGASDFQLLKRALLNERLSPEILHYKADLVERVKDGLLRQETELEDMESQRDMDLVQQVLSYEQDRVRFLLKSYLRARLEKIEQYHGAILDSTELRARLSPQEAKFCSDIFVAYGRHFKQSVLDDMPSQYASLVKRYEAEPSRKLLELPNLDKYVFCRVLDDCGQVPDGPDGQTAELNMGDIMVVKYTTVRHLIETGQVCLL